jgi:hypothetical protein
MMTPEFYTTRPGATNAHRGRPRYSPWYTRAVAAVDQGIARGIPGAVAVVDLGIARDRPGAAAGRARHSP